MPPFFIVLWGVAGLSRPGPPKSAPANGILAEWLRRLIRNQLGTFPREFESLRCRLFGIFRLIFAIFRLIFAIFTLIFAPTCPRARTRAQKTLKKHTKNPVCDSITFATGRGDRFLARTRRSQRVQASGL